MNPVLRLVQQNAAQRDRLDRSGRNAAASRHWPRGGLPTITPVAAASPSVYMVLQIQNDLYGQPRPVWDWLRWHA